MLLSASQPESFYKPMSVDSMPVAALEAKCLPSTSCFLARNKTFPRVSQRSRCSELGGRYQTTSGSGFSLKDFNVELSDTFAAPVETKKAKKRVAFADDHGYELVTIKFMTDESNDTHESYDDPKMVSAPMQVLIKTEREENFKVFLQWAVSFKQPASDYLVFHNKLVETNVGLANVLLNNDKRQLMGIVKVKNLGLHKNVFVRVTDNQWASYKDYPCIFLPISLASDQSGFDTFQFDFKMPVCDKPDQVIELCVCFRQLGENMQEYWDNNWGQNFRLVTEKRSQRNAQKWSRQ